MNKRKEVRGDRFPAGSEEERRAILLWRDPLLRRIVDEYYQLRDPENAGRKDILYCQMRRRRTDILTSPNPEILIERAIGEHEKEAR